MTGRFEKLNALSRLLDEGKVTREEFKVLKAELLVETPQEPDGMETERSEAASAGANESTTVAARRSELPWPIVWSIGFFFVGVGINSLIDAAMLWGYSPYRGSLLWSMFPYVLASIGLFTGLARRHRSSNKRYSLIATTLSLSLVLAIGFVAFQANAESRTSPTLVGSEAATTVPQVLPPTTHRSSIPLAIDRSAYCLDNWDTDMSCEADMGLAHLIFENYRPRVWTPLLADIRIYVEEGDESGARVACEAAKRHLAHFGDAILQFDDDEPSLVAAATPMVDSMLIMAGACSNGHWDEANDAINEVNRYLFDEVCPRTIYVCRRPSGG